MRTIKGRFFNPHDGKPAAYAQLNLKLIRELPDDAPDGVEPTDVVPLGELAESLKIPVDTDLLEGWREEQKSFGHSDEEIAREEAIEFPQCYDIPQDYSFHLDGQGCVLPGTQVIGCDELSGVHKYHVCVTQMNGSFDPTCFRETLRIVGDAPVDLNAIVPPRPLPEFQPRPEPPPLPARRDPSVNYHGFIPGAIGVPDSGAAIPIAEGERSFRFHLDSKSVVREARIIIDRAASRRLNLKLINAATGREACRVSIDTSSVGIATAFLDKTATLPAGDYDLMWRIEDASQELRVRSLGIGSDHLRLIDAKFDPPMVRFSA